MINVKPVFELSKINCTLKFLPLILNLQLSGFRWRTFDRYASAGKVDFLKMLSDLDL